MRILHTSDWHLGQYFMGKTRQAEHQGFIDWLLAQVQAHDVDAVIVAGDIFDSGAPPSYARELYNRLVVALHRAGCALLILGGNHDSVATLAESRPLLSCLSTEVIPAVQAESAQQVLLLKQRDGSPGALVCAIPFIRARDVLQSQAGQNAEDKQLALQQAIHAHYQTLYQQACAKRAALGLSLPIVMTGHLTTVGASASESVREIYVGALAAFPTQAFPPADYIALGHIHRPQRVGGHEHIRYSGSPIPLSFDEAGQQKEVLLVELDASGLLQVRALPVPVFQPLIALKGTLDELGPALQAAARGAPPEQTIWLEVLVRGDDYLCDLQNRIQALCQGLPLEVLRLRRDRGADVATLVSMTQATLDELSPVEVFARRLALETLDEPVRVELTARYQQVLDSLQELDA